MARPDPADRVLIIDDDLMSREVLTLLLHTEGYTVESVASGDDALALLRSAPAPPAIILTDIQMPGTSGCELGRELRKLHGQRTILIAMSGNDVAANELTAYDAFLLKPFRASDVTAAIADRRSRNLNGDFASNTSMSSQAHSPLATPLPGLVSTNDADALDERIFRQLGETMPAPQLRQMYRLCVDDVRKRITDMRGLADRQDGTQFIRQAHAIKGGCGMLGASELYCMAARLEKGGLSAAGLNDGTGVNPLDELAAACDRLERILEART